MKQKITIEEAIYKRMSIRKYDMKGLSKEELADIIKYANNVEPLIKDSKIRVDLIGPDDVKSIMPWKAPHYLAIYAEDNDMSKVNVGFIYEQVVLYLTSLGLGTCWAESVSPKDKNESDGLKWMIVVAFGKEENDKPWRENLNQIRRKPVNEVSDKEDERLKEALAAPSAMNNQPWYYTHVDDKIRVYCAKQNMLKKWMSSMNKFDVGISISHIKVMNKDFKFEVEKDVKDIKGYTYIGTISI